MCIIMLSFFYYGRIMKLRKYRLRCIDYKVRDESADRANMPETAICTSANKSNCPSVNHRIDLVSSILCVNY